MKKHMYLIVSIMILIMVLLNKTDVNASESTYDSSTEQYTYTYTVTTTGYDTTDTMIFTSTKTYFIKSDSPFKVVAFRHSFTGNDIIGYYVMPESQTNTNSKLYTSIDGETWQETTCGYITVDGMKVSTYFTSAIYPYSENKQGDYTVETTNMPYMNVSSQEQINEVLKQIANDDWSAYEEFVPITGYDYLLNFQNGYEDNEYFQETDGFYESIVGEVVLVRGYEYGGLIYDFIPVADVTAPIPNGLTAYNVYRYEWANGSSNAIASNISYEQAVYDCQTLINSDYKNTSGLGFWIPMHQSYISTNMKIFNSVENAQAYFETGNTDGMIIPEFNETTFDENANLGYLQRVTYTLETVKQENGFYGIEGIVTWQTDELENGVQIEVMMSGTVRVNGVGVLKEFPFTYASYDTRRTIRYNDGNFTFTQSAIDDEVKEYMSQQASWMDYIPAFYGYEIKEIYIRKVAYNTETAQYMTGGWTRITCDFTNGDNIVTGTMAGDIGNDISTFEEDLSSPDSYSAGMTSDGTYDYYDKEMSDEMLQADKAELDKYLTVNLGWFYTFLKSLVDSLGQVPLFVRHIFGFLPSPIVYTIGALIVVCVILRVIGR